MSSGNFCSSIVDSSNEEKSNTAQQFEDKTTQRLKFGVDAILEKDDTVKEKYNTTILDYAYDPYGCSKRTMPCVHCCGSNEAFFHLEPIYTTAHCLPEFYQTMMYIPTEDNFLFNKRFTNFIVESEKGSSGNVNKRKRTWSRAVFSNLQRKGLEKRFEIQKYIMKPDRRQLAVTLGLTDAQVKVWFQNRRMKWRNTKQSKGQSENSKTTVK